MRAPFRLIEPRMLGVSMGTRGEAASASARGIEAGAAVCAAPGVGGAMP